MKTAICLAAGLFARIAVGLVCTFDALAQDPKPFESTSPFPIDSGVAALNLATNAEQAWILVEGMKPLPPNSKQSQMESSAIAADMCREFVRRYPKERFNRPKQAVKLRYGHLMRTIELGNTNRIAEFEGLVDPRFLLYHSERWGFADLQVLFPHRDTDLARMRAFRAYPAGPAAVRHEWEKNLRALNPWTPEIVYEVLLLAEQSDPEDARRLAQELIKLPYAATLLKKRATNLVEKYEPLGRPIHLKAQTLDGAEFDLEQWKGKVVLLHFWAPKPPQALYHGIDPDWTGLVSARTVYEKFHDRGLEVLSINLARNEKLVRQPVRPENKIPWPHYWANTNLSTELRAAAGLPPGHTLGQTTFALLDQTATLRDRDVPRAELAERIEKLLK